MAKRNFAAMLIVIVIAISSGVRADQAFVGVDGCAVLAQLVYTEVTAAAWDDSPVPSLSNDETSSADISVCSSTARTVSEAYALAMTTIGSDVFWDYPSADPGDYCWSGFLDQCYPRRAPLGARADSWTAVSATIRYAMPLGLASDQSVFSTRVMRKALRAALRPQVRLN
jgi:hypothetical protein